MPLRFYKHASITPGLRVNLSKRSAKPIIFSAPMIVALNEGQKTQTRRVIKPRRPIGSIFHGWYDDATARDPKKWSAADRRDIGYAVGDRLWVREAWDDYAAPLIWYRATSEYANEPSQRWKSPIYMPRWASRLTLTVTDVRVQRIQEISGPDEIAEGVPSRALYRDLWNTLHGAGAWDANPWICALTFTVHKRNVDAAA